MKKLKNGCHFFNINHTEKFPISDPPKVWVSGFLSVDGNRISVSAIMKKLENGCHFFNINHTENFPITDLPPQSLGLWFPAAFQHLCMATLETFMRGYLCMVYESPMCSFTLPDI